jgi:3-hydroxyethyl bacteriochlorophyllide a dehydrogenase
MHARAVTFTGVNQVAVQEIEVPEPGAGQVLVAAEYTCVSPGTELRTLAGKQPGAAPWPLIPGYALVGRVAACGADVQVTPGALVLCNGTQAASIARTWGGHVSHAVTAVGSLIPVPEGVSALSACIARLAAIPYHGLRLAVPQPHDRIVVIGLGLIGQAAARLYAATGAHVVALDRSARRVAQARAAGLDGTVVTGTLQEAAARFFPQGADVVVDATGVNGVAQEAVYLAHEVPWNNDPQCGARYVVQGSYPADFALPYQEAFARQVRFIVPRDWQRQDFEAAVGLIRRGKVALDDLVTEVRDPAQAPESYAQLQDPQGPLMTVAFRW